MINVGKYSMHGAYGLYLLVEFLQNPFNGPLPTHVSRGRDYFDRPRTLKAYDAFSLSVWGTQDGSIK